MWYAIKNGPTPTEMDTNRINTLFQFILAFAGQADEVFHRRLRPIHLLKYAYLADLSFAERNNGKSFTGIVWKFHHFGPWSLEAYEQIVPSFAAIGANSRTVENNYDEKDRTEWWWDGEEKELENLRRSLPACIVFPLQRHIKSFGGYATYDLLHYVYNTKPMRQAAPEEILVFSAADVAPHSEPPVDKVVMSAKQRKLRRAKFAEAKGRLQEALEKMVAKPNRSTGFVRPVYDAVFFEGLACFEFLAANDLREGEYTLDIDPSVWKSGSRTDNDLS